MMSLFVFFKSFFISKQTKHNNCELNIQCFPLFCTPPAESHALTTQPHAQVLVVGKHMKVNI